MILKPVVLKTEKDADVFPSGTLRVYVGNRMIGRCILDDTGFFLEDRYAFLSSLDIVQSVCKSDSKDILWIKNYVKESLEFFINELTCL